MTEASSPTLADGCAAGVHDEAGDPMDGDADGITGGDFGLNFTVLVDNLLRNPNLDEGLDHWMIFSDDFDSGDTSRWSITVPTLP